MDELLFDWDENKRISNLEKHGLDFRDAVILITKETKPMLSLIVKNELRHMVTGDLNGKYVTIIYTIRENISRETIYRIISLRHARKGEIGLLLGKPITNNEE